MKYLITLLICMASLMLANAQDSSATSAPKIITKLSVGHSLDFNGTKLKFIRVTEDSRCPTGTECIWAGQAKIVVGIYKNETLQEEKEFVFGSKGINPDHMQEFMAIDEKRIYGYTISPYPTAKKKINPEKYCLELVVK